MIKIRRASLEEHIVIASFQEKMAFETEQLKLDPEILKSGVKAVFSDPAKGTYYVAEKDGETVASLLTTYEWSDWRNGQIIWIQSVYVLPSERGKGIFRKLFRHIRKIVYDNPGYRGIRLYVDKTNENARSIYRHLGMEGDHYQMLEWFPAT